MSDNLVTCPDCGADTWRDQLEEHTDCRRAVAAEAVRDVWSGKEPVIDVAGAVAMLLAAWRDSRATLIDPSTDPWSSVGAPCDYCADAPRKTATMIGSPKWGTWPVCRRCAHVQLVTLHGMTPVHYRDRWSALRAALEFVVFPGRLREDPRPSDAP